MFVAPFSLPLPVEHPHPRMRESPPGAALGALAAWLVSGACLLALFPALRGGATLGATLPFWLVAAPAINLVWLARGRIATAVQHALRRLQRPAIRQARRFQSRARPDRSSR